MSTLQFADIGAICERGSVKDADVAMLRRALAQEVSLRPAQIEALFAIHNACPVQDPAWAEFFLDTVTDYLVREAEPSGYVTRSQSEWLIAHISNGKGRVATKTEFDLLIDVLKQSRWAPVSLACFALAQIRDAVLAGWGPLRGASPLAPGRITAAEVESVRTILCAYGAEGTMAITRSEADVLFAINDAVYPADCAAQWPDAPGWSSLFIRVMIAAMMTASGYAVPSRERMLQDEPWFAREVDHRGELPPLFASYRTQSPEERALERLERQRVEIITGEPVRELQAEWLAQRLGRGVLCGRNEEAVLAALTDVGIRLAPPLQALLDRHHRAA
ncbi:MAG TPA: hypothetical protein VNK52_10150 [Hyphomicrobiaceae bacterium]|nr:hypothetical protein [Hyphomicrobiaceae bacterium]